MTPTASPAVRRAHLETARTLLAVEALALQVLRGSLPPTAGDPIALAYSTTAALVPVLLTIRQAARNKGAERFAAELEAGGARVALPELPPAALDDRLAAERAARFYSDTLLRQAQEWMAEHDAAQANPLLVADAARLESIAATEVSNAFNDERTRIEVAVADMGRDEEWFPFFVKVWDSTLDGRTCKVCDRLHGTKRGWGQNFAGGREPGRVHRNCRCVCSYHAIPIEITPRKRAA